MKSFIAIPALLGLASAQLACLSVVAQVPECGLSCITSAASSLSCDALDLGCQCNEESSRSIQTMAISCVLAACSVETGLMVQSVANNICACVAEPSSAAALAGGASATIPERTESINTTPDVSITDAGAQHGYMAEGAPMTVMGALFAALAAL